MTAPVITTQLYQRGEKLIVDIQEQMGMTIL